MMPLALWNRPVFDSDLLGAVEDDCLHGCWKGGHPCCVCDLEWRMSGWGWNGMNVSRWDL